MGAVQPQSHSDSVHESEVYVAVSDGAALGETVGHPLCQENDLVSARRIGLYPESELPYRRATAFPLDSAVAIVHNLDRVYPVTRRLATAKCLHT